MSWASVIIAGLITYFTRFSMITFVNSKMMSKKVRILLSYVPSSVFPAIIFPAVFYNDLGNFVEINDPKIFGFVAAIIIGFFSRNIIATIFAGLVVYWLFIF
tara:strand:+ start:1099 stop:1404 length:306 start_codon:yes stop_codon:yes gene_type:complete